VVVIVIVIVIVTGDASYRRQAYRYPFVHSRSAAPGLE
jgi:hypothetical protein